MPLWGKTDQANNSVKWVARSLQQGSGKAAQATKNTQLYGNTTANTFIPKQAVGQFGVSTAEMASANSSSDRKKVTHAGWQLRRAGTGGRAGRVQYECLVAMGSLSNGASDDTQFP